VRGIGANHAAENWKEASTMPLIMLITALVRRFSRRKPARR
jgi:hypothetical protein